MIGRRTFATLLTLLPAASLARVPLWVIEISTDVGKITLELEMTRAPLTAGNFLRLVNSGAYNGAASFYRTVAPNRDKNPVPIAVIQGGIGAAPSPLEPIAHESTAMTGLTHLDGTISMARAAVGTASTEFFICIGDNPELDHGGKRAPDGQGFAAFGRVVGGMEIARAIHQATTGEEGKGTAVEGQLLDPVISIRNAVLNR